MKYIGEMLNKPEDAITCSYKDLPVWSTFTEFCAKAIPIGGSNGILMKTVDGRCIFVTTGSEYTLYSKTTGRNRLCFNVNKFAIVSTEKLD